MEDVSVGTVYKNSFISCASNVPALVQVAAFAIILIRAVDLLMILNQLGIGGIEAFIQRSVQTWTLTLVFLSSLLLVFIEIWCAFSLVKGRNLARWIFLLTQIPSPLISGRPRWGTATRSCSVLPASQNVKFCVLW